MRGFVKAMFVIIAPFVSIGVALFIWLYGEGSAISVIAAIFSFIVLIYLTFKGYNLLNDIGREDMSQWLSSVSHCSHKVAYDGFGIAADEANQKLYLASKFKKKSIRRQYDFCEVREWGYEIPGYDRVVGGRLSDHASNAAAEHEAMENTGFWVKVRDVEFPRWFIKFKCQEGRQKDVQLELSRWMEVLNQAINKS